MIDLSRVILQRADEQTSRPFSFYERERDTWDVPPQPAPPRFKRTVCRFGGCPKPVQAHGYCHAHWMRIRRGTLEAS